MNRTDYWTEITRLDAEVNDLTEQAKRDIPIAEHERLLDKIYDLKQDKKNLQNKQRKLVKGRNA